MGVQMPWGNKKPKSPKCPECGSRMVKLGFQVTNRKGTRKQNYLCTSCRRRTVNPKW